jgi:RNA polymerase sigma-70 factor (ECF subfamily)
MASPANETPGNKSLTDEQLVDSYRNSGEPSAADELVRRHLPRVNGMIYQMVLDESASDDLTQEVFLRAVSRLHTFRGDSSFATWLLRVALNTTYSYLQRRKRSRIEYVPRPPERRDSQPGPDESVLAGELSGEIEAALAGLSPKLRAAIVLTSLQHLDVGEAARIEGCTTAALYWRIHQARKQLRSRLEKWLLP